MTDTDVKIFLSKEILCSEAVEFLISMFSRAGKLIFSVDELVLHKTCNYKTFCLDFSKTISNLSAIVDS